MNEVIELQRFDGRQPILIGRGGDLADRSAPLVPAVFAAVLPEREAECRHHGTDPHDQKH